MACSSSARRAVGIVNGDAADVRAGNDRAVNVNRIAGVGNHDDIALIEGRQTEVRDAFLRAYGDDGFRIRVKAHAIAGVVPLRNGAAQPGDAF